MKKYAVGLLVLAMLCTLLLPASAVEPVAAQTPVFLSSSESISASDIQYVSELDASGADEAEQLRIKVYTELSKKYTDEEIYASNGAFVMYPTKLVCEISVAAGEWYVLGFYGYDTKALSLSLTGDILPCLEKAGCDMLSLSTGFTMSIRFLCASSNYSVNSAGNIFTKSETTGTESFTVPAFVYIKYIIANEATNSSSNPSFLLSAPESDITLGTPTRAGYTFDGWQKKNGYNTGVIPAGTSYIELTALWLAKTYSLNYVLTTDLSHDFSKAQNTNPFTFTSDSVVTFSDAVCRVSGYSFDGWYYTRDFSGGRVTEIPAGTYRDITLYAKWLSDEEANRIESENKTAAAVAKHIGDLDSDGRVTSADARLTLRAAVNLDILSSDMAARVDFFGSGKITSACARIILRIAVKLDDLGEVASESNMI